MPQNPNCSALEALAHAFGPKATVTAVMRGYSFGHFQHTPLPVSNLLPGSGSVCGSEELQAALKKAGAVTPSMIDEVTQAASLQAQVSVFDFLTPDEEEEHCGGGPPVPAAAGKDGAPVSAREARQLLMMMMKGGPLPPRARRTPLGGCGAVLRPLPPLVEAAALLPTCCNSSCTNLDGPTEAALQPLRACARCKRAVYCGRACQVAAWKAGHSKECDGGAAAAAAASAKPGPEATLRPDQPAGSEP